MRSRPLTSPAVRPCSSSSACTAWARRSMRRWSEKASDRPAVPHLRARRRSRGPARLSRAPPLGERRQHLVHQSAGRRRGARRRHRPRSGRGGRARAQRCDDGRPPLDPAPARDLSAAAAGGERPGAQRARRCAPSSSPRWRPPSTTPSRPAPSLPASRCLSATRRASSPARTTGASASAPCASPRRRRPTPPSKARCAPSTPGTGSAARDAPRSSRRRPSSWSATARA